MSFVHRFEPATREATANLLVLHGTGGDENSLLRLAEAVAPGVAMLSVRGKVLENGAPRFFRRFAEGVFDYEDIRFRANELADFVAEAKEQYGLKKLYALGYSNGANIGWSTVLLRPEALEGGALFRPMTTLEDVEDPDLRGKQFFVSAGRQDPIVPIESVENLVSQMKAGGAEVELNWHPGGHELGRDEIERAREWLESLV